MTTAATQATLTISTRKPTSTTIVTPTVTITIITIAISLTTIITTRSTIPKQQQTYNKLRDKEQYTNLNSGYN